MLLYGDYHTHTIFSHGKGTVDQNVKAAIEAGLKEIAISDHGLKHIAFGLKKRKLPKYTQEINAARKKYGISVLKGVEANIISRDGQIDMTADEIKQFDIILCGYHKFIRPKSLKDFFTFFLPNYLLDFFRIKSSQKRIKINTEAVINNIKKFPVDVLTHLNYGLRVNCKAIAEICAEKGTYIELNGKRITYSDNEMRDMLDTKVNFIVNSDAHTTDRVGEVNICKELIERFKIPYERIANFNGQPVWRSHKV
jgi:putative hydrolase